MFPALRRRTDILLQGLFCASRFSTRAGESLFLTDRDSVPWREAVSQPKDMVGNLRNLMLFVSAGDLASIALLSRRSCRAEFTATELIFQSYRRERSIADRRSLLPAVAIHGCLVIVIQWRHNCHDKTNRRTSTITHIVVIH